METLKCVDGDFDIQVATGRPHYIRGIEKAAQDVAYTLLTVYDPVRGIGSELADLETNAKNAYLLPTVQNGYVRRYVESSIRRLMTIQTARLANTPPSEQIVSIDRVDIWQGVSPTDVIFTAMVSTKTKDRLPTSYRIQLGHQLPPGVAAPFTSDDSPVTIGGGA